MDEPDRDHHEPIADVLSEETIATVVENLAKIREFKLHATAEQWEDLNRILTDYQQEALLYDGFLNKGEVDEYNQLQKYADKLLGAISAYKSAGREKLIEVDLKQEGDLDRLVGMLTCLRDGEIGSPKLDVGGKQYWEASLKRAAGFLQIRLDEWWTEVTGAPPEEHDEGDTHYAHFLKDVLQELASPGKNMGGSRTATATRRRGYNKYESPTDEKIKALGKLIKGMSR